MWKTAINDAKVAIRSSDSGQKTILKLLHRYADEADNSKYISKNKNVFLNGVIFADLDDSVDENTIKRKQESINANGDFNSVYIISVQKKTIEKIYDFLKSELNKNEN